MHLSLTLWTRLMLLGSFHSWKNKDLNSPENLCLSSKAVITKYHRLVGWGLEVYKQQIIISEGFPYGSAGKEFSCNVGDLDSIPGMGRSPREEKGYPLQYSGLENSMDCIVHGVTKSWTRLSDFHFLISQILEPGNPRSKGQHDEVLVTALFQLQNTASWVYLHRKQKESELSLDSFLFFWLYQVFIVACEIFRSSVFIASYRIF